MNLKRIIALFIEFEYQMEAKGLDFEESDTEMPVDENYASLT